MGTRCDQCGTNRATTKSLSGRDLCDSCATGFVTLAGAGASMASGAEAATAVGVGIASAGYTGSMEVEQAHRTEQRAKLAAATGFWATLKIRVIG